MHFVSARRLFKLLALALLCNSVIFAGMTPASAKNGEGHGPGGFEGDHDNGRHLGWYKHGGPVMVQPVYPHLGGGIRQEAPFAGGWVGRRAWGGGAWGWQRTVIAAGAAWGVAWAFGQSYTFYAPPVIFVPSPTYVYVPPVVMSVPWIDAPSPF